MQAAIGPHRLFYKGWEAVEAFAAQKDSAEGKKTLMAWYWKICGEQWEQDNQWSCALKKEKSLISGDFSVIGTIFVTIRINNIYMRMKRMILVLTLVALAVGAKASDEVRIDKERCVVIKDGKEFPLYGKVKIVNNFEGVKK